MLYIIASPIGSLDEFSLQAINTLAIADVILCEDTRTFVPAFNQLITNHKLLVNSSQKIQKYYKDIEFEDLHKWIKLLEEGKNIVLISEAGTPLVSDPGRLIINTCQKRGIPFTSVPGSSAPMNAGVLAGCRFDNFLIVGFLPKKKSAIEKQLLVYKETSRSLKNLEICFFESPKRISETLEIIAEILPDVTIHICREMNKKFEEVLTGKATDLKTNTYKGELTVIIKF